MHINSTMKPFIVFFLAVYVGASFAFAPPSFCAPSSLRSKNNDNCNANTPVGTTSSTALNVLISEYATREVYPMETWAENYGMQKADGVELFSEDDKDYELITTEPIEAGSTILYVPSDIVLNSDSILYEMGDYLAEAEAQLQIDSGTAQRLPLFRLMVKLLVEYEKLEKSPYYPWLNSLPRVFYNGVAMTDVSRYLV